MIISSVVGKDQHDRRERERRADRPRAAASGRRRRRASATERHRSAGRCPEPPYSGRREHRPGDPLGHRRTGTDRRRRWRPTSLTSRAPSSSRWRAGPRSGRRPSPTSTASRGRTAGTAASSATRRSTSSTSRPRTPSTRPSRSRRSRPARRSWSRRPSRPPSPAPSGSIEAARREQVFAMEAMWTRFQPARGQIRELIADGAIGEVRQVQADLGVDRPYDPTDRLFDPAQGGGAMLDLGRLRGLVRPALPRRPRPGVGQRLARADRASTPRPGCCSATTTAGPPRLLMSLRNPTPGAGPAARHRRLDRDPAALPPPEVVRPRPDAATSRRRIELPPHGVGLQPRARRGDRAACGRAVPRARSCRSRDTLAVQRVLNDACEQLGVVPPRGRRGSPCERARADRDARRSPPPCSPASSRGRGAALSRDGSTSWSGSASGPRTGLTVHPAPSRSRRPGRLAAVHRAASCCPSLISLGPTLLAGAVIGGAGRAWSSPRRWDRQGPLRAALTGALVTFVVAFIINTTVLSRDRQSAADLPNAGRTSSATRR